MANWLVTPKAKSVAIGLVCTGMALSCVDVGIGLFGGAKAAFYRKVPPGYVEIEIAARTNGGHPTYVKPWVANFHHGVVSAMFLAFVPGVCLLIFIRMARAVPENSDLES